MATSPEALTQLARLLGEPLATGASLEDVRDAIDRRFDFLVDGLVAEAAASDDVYDRESAFEFLNLRIGDLHGWLSDEQRTRLLAALRGKIEAW
jgi:hypothetical protein